MKKLNKSGTLPMAVNKAKRKVDAYSYGESFNGDDAERSIDLDQEKE